VKAEDTLVTAPDNLIRVWLIDDTELVRINIDEFLQNHLTIHLRAFSSCEDAFETLTKVHIDPHVILLDIELDGINGLVAIPKFLDMVPGVRIIILTSLPNDSNIEKAISLGAHGFLEKAQNTLDKIIPSIEQAIQGLMVLDNIASQKVWKMYKSKTMKRESYELNDRESQALHHLADGMSREEVADAMYVSPSTVHTYEDRLHKKFHVNSRTALVAKAIREGLV